MPPPPPHPLRRISTGSLSNLARSQDRPSEASPSGLDFLSSAMTDLADEAATLATNVQRMNMLHDALGTFNEGFSAYMYALKMNAFCIEWPEAPDQHSWSRLPELTRPPTPPTPKPKAPSPRSSRPASPSTASRSHHAGDLTYATVYSVGDDELPSQPSKSSARGRGGAVSAGRGGRGGRGGAVGAGASAPGARKAPLSAAAKKAQLAAKKKRELLVAGIIEKELPIEYRGSDPNARLAMERVIGKLMDNDGGLAIGQIVLPPDLPHPRVNKCLISLVAKKLVVKGNDGGKTIYRWVGL